MADNFEKAKDDILFRTEGNGGPTPRDILVALGALADDQDENHKESIEAIGENRRLLEAHFEEADRRDHRILAIEEKIAKSEAECPARVKAAIHAEHENRHNAYVASLVKPRRKGDPDGKDYRNDRDESRQVWFMWMIGSKVSYILMAVLITVLNIGLHYLLMGEP